VNQFLYMGAEDENDTIPYDDAWTDDSLRQVALDVYGDDMISERFPTCAMAYREAGIDAAFRVYEGAGHTPRPAFDDIVAVHRRTVRGKGVPESIGGSVAPSVGFDVVGTDGGSVEFDAGRSTGGTVSLSRFLWDFGDGETAFGEVVAHEFREAGEYEVSLTVIAETGEEYSDARTVRIAQNGDASVAEAGPEEAESESDGSTAGESGGSADGGGSGDGNTTSDGAGDADDGASRAGTDESVPGFGATGAVGGLGGAAYLLSRRFGDRTEED
jgi:PGF-CTERM protein